MQARNGIMGPKSGKPIFQFVFPLKKHKHGDNKCGLLNTNQINRTGISSSRILNDGISLKMPEWFRQRTVRLCRKTHALHPCRHHRKCAAPRHPMNHWRSARNVSSGRRCGGCPRRNAVMQPKHGLSANTADAAN